MSFPLWFICRHCHRLKLRTASNGKTVIEKWMRRRRHRLLSGVLGSLNRDTKNLHAPQSVLPVTWPSFKASLSRIWDTFFTNQTKKIQFLLHKTYHVNTGNTNLLKVNKFRPNIYSGLWNVLHIEWSINYSAYWKLKQSKCLYTIKIQHHVPLCATSLKPFCISFHAKKLSLQKLWHIFLIRSKLFNNISTLLCFLTLL
jgi:hypothetical protein